MQTTHTVETSRVLETSRLHTTVPAVIMSSFVSNPQQSSIPSPVRTTQPVPSSKENTVSSSSSTSTTTSNIRMLSTAFVGTAIPTTSSTTEASDTSSRSRTIPSSTSTTHTSPSTSMGSSPSPDITEVSYLLCVHIEWTKTIHAQCLEQYFMDISVSKISDGALN